MPYARVDGVIIANNWADLIDGTLANPINKTETNGAPPVGTATCVASVSVWTNTLQNGTIFNANNSCTNWTSTNGGSHWGYNNATNVNWSSACQGGSCAWQEPIYCFQQ